MMLNCPKRLFLPVNPILKIPKDSGAICLTTMPFPHCGDILGLASADAWILK